MIDAKVLKKKIDDHSTRALEIERQSAYVKGLHPGILEPRPKEEPDNRVPVPIARRAVDMVSGYLFKEGNIVYKGDGYDDALKETLDANEEGLVNLELGMAALTHGAAYEEHWTEGSADQFAQIPAGQCIPIYTDSLKPKLAEFIRYWETDDGDCRAATYDSRIKQYYAKKRGAYEWSIDGPPIPHGYGRVPIVRYRIAGDGSNLFDHVRPLIDLFDKIMSEDFANELAKFASSYLLTSSRFDDRPDDYGENEIDKIKRTGVFQGLTEPVTNQIAFLTKSVNDAFLNSSADRTERLIYEMLSLFNPNDDTFAAASGIAQEYKLLGFEYLCTRITSYFSMGLQDRIALIKGLDANLSTAPARNTDVTIDWKRNLPRDLMLTAQIVSAMGGRLSDETLVKLWPASVVENVDEEIARLKDKAPDVLGEVERLPMEDPDEELEEDDDRA